MKENIYWAGRRLPAFLACLFISYSGLAQGTWNHVAISAPDPNSGTMLLLPNGSVMVKTQSGGSDGSGTMWDLLTPDNQGSYINGNWGVVSPMNDSRLYFSTQVLRDGRVYVAGGEYGTGKASAEIYDPSGDTWQVLTVPPGDTFYDASSEMLPDGRVLQAVNYDLSLPGPWGRSTIIFDPSTNSYSPGLPTNFFHTEASWVKLPDNTILFIDWDDTTSERYDPVTDTWMMDASVPVNIYDTTSRETGPAILLPNGKAMVFGGNGKTAIYTPSGTLAPGTWVAGPPMPAGMGAPDAPASVMPGGKVLLTCSSIPVGLNWFPSPTSFYVFDYRTNIYTRINGPFGLDTLSGPCFTTHMLNLPDGSVLFSVAGSADYFIFQPTDTAMASGKPSIDTIIKLSCDTFMATGKLFNGLNEGSYYGDDWQMSTNYPLVRLTQSGNVSYATTYNWNRTGVMTGSLKDTTFFILPAGLPEGTYALQLVANGNPSLSRTFKTCKASEVEEFNNKEQFTVYPNPASGQAVVRFSTTEARDYKLTVADMLGRILLVQDGKGSQGDNHAAINVSKLSVGVYTISLQYDNINYRSTIAVGR